jgi:predicted permease
MSKFIYSFSLILFGLFLGYGVQLLAVSGRMTLPMPAEQLRKLLQKIALLFLNPVAIAGAVWAVDINSVSIAALPLVGFFALVAGGVLALGSARLMKLEPEKKGAMFCCGSFTNIGSIGALICFVFLGEAGFALVPIYKLFEEVSYYAIGFPIARFYAGSDVEDRNVSERLLGLARDPFILVAVSSILIGGILNWSGLPRPGFYKSLISVFVPLGTVMLLASIGLALRFRRVRAYLKESAVVAVIKFFMVPVCATTLAYFIGFGHIDGGLPLKVVLVLSSMPVAFNALIPPSIYDLDLDLANSCWFVTTALLVVVLPLLLFILNAVF